MWAWTFNDSREGRCVPVARVQYELKRKLNTLHLVSGLCLKYIIKNAAENPGCQVWNFICKLWKALAENVKFCSSHVKFGTLQSGPFLLGHKTALLHTADTCYTNS